MDINDLTNRNWLLLPGTLCTGEVFTGLLDQLGVARSGRHVVDLAYPRIDDYRDVLARSSKGAVVCGFSLGAIVAAHLSDSLDAAAIILIGVNPYPDDPAKKAVRDALEQDVLTIGGAGAMAYRLHHIYGPRPEAARELILTMADASSGGITAQTQLALSRPGALAALGRSQCPVLALTGDQDQMAPPLLGKAAAEAAPLGRFQLLSGLGHYALAEDPQSCAKAIRGQLF